MKVLVGLGNPGAKYAKTRHNIGFWVIDQLCERHRLRLDTDDSLCQYGSGRICGQSVLLIKPQTFMNLSGKAVVRAMNRLAKKPVKDLQDVWVFHDDIELDLGRLKVRPGGSDAGHRGLASIRETVGGDFLRFRLGIGRPPRNQDVSDYVIDPFKPTEEALAQALAEWASQAAEEVLATGLNKALNRIHRQDYPTGFGPET